MSRMDLISHIALLFIAGIACAFLGWGVVYISAQVEQRRAIHHLEKYGTSSAPPTRKNASES